MKRLLLNILLLLAVRMVCAQQWVTFTVRPENVILTVDETRMVIRDGHAKMLLSPGPHRYSAESPYFEPLTDTFTLKDSTRRDILVVMQSVYSYLDVVTHYKNAVIYVDRRDVGRGHTVTCRNTYGDHRLTVINGDTCLFDGKVTLGKAEKKSVDIASLGVTPFPWDPARWLIPLSALSADGTLTDSTLLEEAHREMELDLCGVNVTSNVAGAEIYIDGRFSGTTPLVIPGLVANRKYLVTVRKAGYKDASATFSADAGAVGTVKLKLKK